MICDRIPRSLLRGSSFVPETTRHRHLKSPTPDDETTTILQGQFSVAGPRLGKRYIETVGVGPCVVVTFYDPETHHAAMAHFRTRSDVASTLRDMSARGGVRRLIYELLEVKRTNLNLLLQAFLTKLVNMVKLLRRMC